MITTADALARCVRQGHALVYVVLRGLGLAVTCGAVPLCSLSALLQLVTGQGSVKLSWHLAGWQVWLAESSGHAGVKGLSP
jgi:hypothetical protein